MEDEREPRSLVRNSIHMFPLPSPQPQPPPSSSSTGSATPPPVVERALGLACGALCPHARARVRGVASLRGREAGPGRRDSSTRKL